MDPRNMLGTFLLCLVITADVSVLHPKRVKRMNSQKELYELSGPKLDKVVRLKVLRCRYLGPSLELLLQKQT